MPLPGGAAAKVSITYEQFWTIRQLLRLMSGEVDWIRLEPPNPDDHLIEFRIGLRGSEIEVHQVKRQNKGEGRWTIAELQAKDVLNGITKHVIESGESYQFVSMDSVKGLRELSDRARDSEDLNEFETFFLGNKKLTRDLDDFCSKMGSISREKAWTVLRACRFTPQDEAELENMVRALLGAWVDGDTINVQDSLSRYVDNSIHQRISGTDVWNFLEKEGYSPANMANDQGLIVRLRQCTQDYLESQRFDIAGVVHERGEALTVYETLSHENPEADVVFLTGAAGSGKTGVAAQVVQRLTDEGWPVLAFRMDKFDPTRRVSKLGHQLLAKEKSPVAILAAIANGEDCLLVLEQVDSVSVTSGRNPFFFECVANMVHEARAHPNMRIILVCRSFDLENDNRFRELKASAKERARTIHVASFEVDEVKAILTDLGTDASKFSPQQLELLRLPLHLYLFATTRSEDESETPVFTNAKDLFDAFWDRKYAEVSPGMDTANNFNLILEKICNKMNALQSLSVPRVVVRELRADADRLVSANVLIDQGGRISFFHEGFFDYVFARAFADSGQPLVEFLNNTSQDLFIRGQIRQILIFQRDQDFDQYIADIKSILASGDIRFHVKSLMIGVIGTVRTPTAAEWSVLERLLTSEAIGEPDNVRSALSISTPWFRFLMETGALPQWICGDSEKENNLALNFAHQLARQEPDLVAELLGHAIGNSEAQDRRLIQVVSWADGAQQSTALEEVFFQIAGQDERDWDFRHQAFHDFIHGQHTKGVDVACRALGRWVELLSDAPDDKNPLMHYGRRNEVLEPYLYEALQSRAPVQFVRSVAGPLLTLMNSVAIKGKQGPPYSDNIWHQGFQRHSHHEPECMLYALTDSILRTAYFSEADYDAVINCLQESDCRTAHAVLLRAIVVNRPDRIDNAVDYLEKQWRSYGFWYDRFAFWDLCELLRLMAPNIGEAETCRLEQFILNHWEQWQPYTSADDCPETIEVENREKARWHLNYHRGWEQFQLLSALPGSCMSEAAGKRLAELSRKFGDRKFEQPWSSRGGSVISPLSGEITQHMNDQQWLSALKRYAKEGEHKWQGNDTLGGAEQLAFAMEVQVKEDPNRFARLMLEFPEDTNEAYFSAVLRGVQGGELQSDLLGHVVQLSHTRPNQPHGQHIAEIISGHAKNDLSSGLLDLLGWYALEDKDPAEDIWRKEAEFGGKHYGGSPYGYGINTNRGVAAQAIGRMIAIDEQYWDHFLPTVTQMTNDPSIAVRSCVAEACTQGLRYDREKAIRLFLKLCETDDELLGTQTIQTFLNYTCTSDFEEIEETLKRMIDSDIDDAREIGARQACVAALSEPKARPLAEAALAGDELMRRGAAEVFSRNLFLDTGAGYCREHLIPLFDDDAEDVRNASSDWLWQAENEGELKDTLPVAEAYIRSRAFLDSPSNFFRMLEKNVDAPPNLLFEAGRIFLNDVGRDAGDIQTRNALSGETLSKLILRAYHQAGDDTALRISCLDLFDHLLAVGAYGASQALSTLER